VTVADSSGRRRRSRAGHLAANAPPAGSFMEAADCSKRQDPRADSPADRPRLRVSTTRGSRRQESARNLQAGGHWFEPSTAR
jgi:hypothetical protein